MSLNFQHSDFKTIKIATEAKRMPLPMQYMGGKGRIVHDIIGGISSSFGDVSRFIDLFAGSGVVSFQAMLKGYKVSANDIQPYSSTVLSSMLVHSTDGIDNLIEGLTNITDDQIFGNSRTNYLADYFTEKSFIIDLDADRFDWKKYQNFCESVILSSGKKADIKTLMANEQWTLFLSYYRNTYFGVRQCAEIDYLRELSEKIDENLKGHLLACVVSSLTYCVSSTTHLAQFLKPSSERNSKNLLKKRSLKVIDLVISRLRLLSNQNVPRNGTVLNSDFRDAIDKLKLDSTCVVYADPPYFKEHYSRYYHVLDTFVLYDYPELTFNKRLGETTKGRYREDRLVSDFGKKSLVRNAFDELCDSCLKYGNKLAISYACTSLVEKDFFYRIAEEKHLNLEVLEFELIHTGQGQARHKHVTEYLFLFSHA